MNPIYQKRYSEQEILECCPVEKAVVRRYAGCSKLPEAEVPALDAELEAVLKDMENSPVYRVCYREFELKWEDGMPVLPFPCVSRQLAKWLKDSTRVVFFAATVGLEVDRWIAKYQRFQQTKALFAQAFGAERIEALCDAFCRERELLAAAEGFTCTGRFSPGYGDLPLESQKDFFQLLDCQRQIGLALNDSLLMSPTKSVTAVFGLKPCLPAADVQDRINGSQETSSRA